MHACMHAYIHTATYGHLNQTYFVRPAVRTVQSEKSQHIQITSHSPSTRHRILTKCVAALPTLSQPSPHPGVAAAVESMFATIAGPEATVYLPLDVEFNISLGRKGPSPGTGHEEGPPHFFYFLEEYRWCSRPNRAARLFMFYRYFFHGVNAYSACVSCAPAVRTVQSEK